jgi:hypothetical protein
MVNRLLFRRDADEREFVRPARRYLSAIRRGMSEADAAKRARISADQPRTWMREPAFAQAYRRALTGVRPRVVSLSDYWSDDDRRDLVKQRMEDMNIHTDPYGRWMP